MTPIHPQKHLRNLLISVVQVLCLRQRKRACLTQNLKDRDALKNRTPRNGDVVLFVHAGHPARSLCQVKENIHAGLLPLILDVGVKTRV